MERKRQSTNVEQAGTWDDIIASALYNSVPPAFHDDQSSIREYVKHSGLLSSIFGTGDNPKTVDEMPQPSNAPETDEWGVGKQLNTLDRLFNESMRSSADDRVFLAYMEAKRRNNEPPTPEEMQRYVRLKMPGIENIKPEVPKRPARYGRFTLEGRTRFPRGKYDPLDNWLSGEEDQ